MSSSAKASQEAGLCVLTVQALLFAEEAEFLVDLALQSFGSPLGASHVYTGQALLLSPLSSIFYQVFHIFGESFRLQAEKLIFKTEVQPAYYPSKVSFIKNKRHTHAPHIEKTHTAKRPIKVLLYIRREALFLQAASSWSPWRPSRGQKQRESHRSFMGSGITKADCSLFR